MNKKPTGLIASAMAETPDERAKREARKAFIAEWEQENPDYYSYLKKLTKAQLIRRLSRDRIGAIYDKVYDDALFTSDTRKETAERIERIKQIIPLLKKGSTEEKLATLENFKTELLALAANDIKLVAQFVEDVCAMKARIIEEPKIKTHQTRIDGGKIRGEAQRAEKDVRHKLIEEKEAELAATTPPRKLNKEIAKATCLETEYVRRARKEIKQKATSS